MRAKQTFCGNNRGLASRYRCPPLVPRLVCLAPRLSLLFLLFFPSFRPGFLLASPHLPSRLSSSPFSSLPALFYFLLKSTPAPPHSPLVFPVSLFSLSSLIPLRRPRSPASPPLSFPLPLFFLLVFLSPVFCHLIFLFVPPPKSLMVDLVLTYFYSSYALYFLIDIIFSFIFL